MSELLQVSNLSVHFDTPQGVVRANRQVSLRVTEGVSFGLIGESGCGKSVLAMAIQGLQQPGRVVEGSIQLDGHEVTKLDERQLRPLRGTTVGLVPQELGTALNPLRTVGFHLEEAAERSRAANGIVGRSYTTGKSQGWDALSHPLTRVGLPNPDRLLGRYPHELSIGMRQRVLLSLAIVLKPKLLICDEPTTALDVGTKSIVLRLLASLTDEGCTLFLISHDLEAVASLCSEVAVMYAGAIVETGRCADVLARPLHPYTRALLRSQTIKRGNPVVTIPGDAPDLISFPAGCAFHPRCPQAMPLCSSEVPPTRSPDSRTVVCHAYH